MLPTITDKKSGSFSKPPQHSRLSSSSTQHPEVRKILHRPAVQPKLKLGASNDSYEQEADRVAEQVLRMPEPGQSADDASSVESAKSCTKCVTREAGVIQAKLNAALDEQQGGHETDDDEGMLQEKTESGLLHEWAPAIKTGTYTLQGAGQPLTRSTRSFFEPRFGTDLSKVRVHHDTHAASLAQSINAHAFTQGRNIVFGPGDYSPATTSGRKLLAHELTHVV